MQLQIGCLIRLKNFADKVESNNGVFQNEVQEPTLKGQCLQSSIKLQNSFIL